jgi:hypothetical protein
MPDALRIVQKYFPQVETVKSAMRQLKITVTSSDARHPLGRKKHDDCAMARACTRSLSVDGALISLGAAYLVKGTKATRYKTPHAVSREIVAYDRGAAFEPGIYTLDVPQVRAGAKRTRTKETRRRTHTERPRHLTSNVREALSARK